MAAGPAIRLAANPLPSVAPARCVYLAVPAYTGSVSVQTASSLIAACKALSDAGVDVVTDFMAGCCYLDHTRNLLSARFLASNATDLVFIDADVGFEPAALMRLALAERPMVAGVYPKKVPDRDSQQWPIDFETDGLVVDGDLIEAAHVATGFLRINRAVFESMIAGGMALEYANETPRLRRFFRCEVRDGVYWGEDFQFCQDWLALGGKIHIIPDLNFEHVGVKTWRGNWGDWIRSPEVQRDAKLEAAE